MSRRYDCALVVGKFAPPHKGHQLLIETARAESGRVIVLVWTNPDFPAMPSATRADWLRALYPDAEVFVPEDPPPDDAPDDVHRAFVRRWLEARGLRPDVVFTSETYGAGFAAHLGVTHRAVDPARSRVPISGTLVRADPHAHRVLLDPRIYRHFVERVVFLGAESTGKSTLARRMAEEMGTAFVPEYGRTSYEEKGGELALEDYIAIARGHRAREDEAILGANRYLFIDTNAITTMFFSHYYNQDSLPELRALARECRGRYHHVFVCADDIPFEQDGWRDNEVWRGRMQGLVLYDLAVREIPYHLVTGPLDARVGQVRAVLQGESLPTSPLRMRSLGPRGPGSSPSTGEVPQDG